MNQSSYKVSFRVTPATAETQAMSQEKIQQLLESTVKVMLPVVSDFCVTQQAIEETHQFSVQEWLNAPCNTDKSVTNAQRLCFLLFANGGSFRVKQWGYLSKFNGHQFGLEQNHALELLSYSGFVHGLEAGGLEFHDQFLPIYKAYSKNYEKPYVTQSNN